MKSKNTSVSLEEIRFLLKDFPCDPSDAQGAQGYEAPFAAPATARERSIRRESLARQLRRLFAASTQQR